jgi:hypothetical protein
MPTGTRSAWGAPRGPFWSPYRRCKIQEAAAAAVDNLITNLAPLIYRAADDQFTGVPKSNIAEPTFWLNVFVVLQTGESNILAEAKKRGEKRSRNGQWGAKS